MAYVEKPGDISVFKNDRKEKDTHPDYRIVGTGLDGQKIRGALWLKKDRNGKTYMSGKIEPDQPRDDFRGGGDEGVSGGGRHQQTFAAKDGGRGGFDPGGDVPF